jgi:leader peptidase (prepilin peptidase)/N-methyltransferase
VSAPPFEGRCPLPKGPVFFVLPFFLNSARFLSRVGGKKPFPNFSSLLLKLGLKKAEIKEDNGIESGETFRETVVTILFFIFGLAVGSFLNVCIYRLPRGESIVWPPSRCPHCDRPIRPLDNIPLLSYLMLRGRCRDCQAPIPLHYPAVEALTGILFALLYRKFGLSVELGMGVVLVCLLLVITFIDLHFKLILNKLTVIGTVSGLFLALLPGRPAWLDAVVGIVAGGLLMLFIAYFGEALFKKESMGMGDVKMGAMIGAFLGVKGVLMALFLGFLLAGIFSAGGILMRKLSRKSYLPFGPFIAAGALISFLWGPALVNWYLEVWVLS